MDHTGMLMQNNVLKPKLVEKEIYKGAHMFIQDYVLCF